MKVAIVHEWLVTFAGSEQVVAAILKIWPDADLFSIVDFLSDEDRKKISGKRAITSFVQRMPFAKKKYQTYLPLMPLAVEQFDLSGYDLVISSSHAVSKGVLVGPNQTHISYIHSPIRYAWDFQHQYLRGAGLDRGFRSWMARIVLHYMRLWDVRSSVGVDFFVANSNFIRRRILKSYRRDAVVIYPPVATQSFTMNEVKEDFYLAASRLVPYKRMELIVEAFKSMPEKKLVVIGGGPELNKLKALATANVQVLGFQPFDVLRDHLQRAKAFIFAAEEDFGIAPVEAQACGTPVIAFGSGGALETIKSTFPGATGVFFYQQTSSAIVDAVQRFESIASEIYASECSLNAERFSAATFERNFRDFVMSKLADGQRGINAIAGTTSDL